MIYQTQKLIFCLLFVPISIFGTSLSEYQQKIKDVTESVGYLNYPEEYLSEKQNIDQQKGIIKEIRTRLPLNEKVELKETNFEVNHDWLYQKLKEFEDEPYRSTKRTPIVDEILARLSALEVKVNELLKEELAKRTKDEEKQKLDEILRRAEYQTPAQTEESWLQRKWREFWDWLWSFRKDGEKADRKAEGSPLLSAALLYSILGATLALILYLAYRFAPSIWRQIRERENKDKNSRVILGETLSGDESSKSIFAEAEDLARSGNLRGAIRKGYIAFLCELSDRKIIGLARHKTNRDYLRDVKEKKEIHQNMNALTLNFERNWYGVNQSVEKDWEDFKQTYQQTIIKEK